MIIDMLSILYLIIAAIIYRAVRPSMRKGLLLIFSVIYLAYIDVKALIAVIISGTAVFLFGKLIDVLVKKEKQKLSRNILILAISVIIVFFIMFRYAHLVYKMGYISESLAAGFIVPVGFSFYMLGCISYLSDIYTGKSTAESSILSFALYVTYFPKFVSGPIEKESEMSSKFAGLASNGHMKLDDFKLAISRIVFGIFLKIAVADRLGIYVNDIYDHMSEFGSVALLVGTIFYSFQIYCDFAGYTSFARGASLLFGIDIMENFKTPYCSENIGEFWRRWHISLSSWLRDYIYIPLGGNRKGDGRKLANLLIVFIVSGFWHGATAGFLVWGLLHGLFSVADNVFKKMNINVLRTGITGRIICFIEVAFAWVFFRASTAFDALNYFKYMFSNGIRWGYITIHFRDTWRQIIDPAIAIAFLIMIMVLDVVAYKKEKDIPTIISEKRSITYILVLYTLLMLAVVFGIYGTSIFAKTFIYMQF